MKPEQIEELIISCMPIGYSQRLDIRAAILRAIEIEREEIAETVYDLPVNFERCNILQITSQAWGEALEQAEAAIRARGTK
jgi:hypothetical protein